MDEIFVKYSNEKENQINNNKLCYESLNNSENRLKDLENNLKKDKELFLKEKEILNIKESICYS